MKIIKKGKLPQDAVVRGSCGHCETVVEAKINELKVNDPGRSPLYHTGACPLCGKTITFQNKVTYDDVMNSGRV